ncbi:MAG: hypothetical protein IT204_06935 [Fimbriimonadaceae bacterium]|nr:hypothetical protein [Fimbriimonadaceae bacterium]
MDTDLQALAAAQQSGWAGLRKQLAEPNELYGCLPDILGCLMALGWGLAARYLADGGAAAVLLWFFLLPIGAAGLAGAYGGTDTLRRWPMAAGWASGYLLAAGLWAFRYTPAALAWPLLAGSLLVLALQELAARRIRNAALRHWRLPPSVLEILDQLPKQVDGALELRLDAGITAYQRLLTIREALPVVGATLDEGLLPEAAATLESLLRHVLVATALPRDADGPAYPALDETLSRLHAAVDAALRLAGSEDADGSALEARIADVHDLASGLDEVRRDVPG